MSMFQIRIVPDGAWHRRQVGGDPGKTACGESIGGAVASRDYELDENLCPKCFTKAERKTGEFLKLERDQPPRDMFDEPDQKTDPDGDAAIAELVKKPTE